MLETTTTKPAPRPPFLPPEVHAAPRLGWRQRLLGGLPTLLVIAGLVGIAVWGHHTGWAVPKFSSLTGNGAKVQDDWCAAHSIAESQCVECNPGLLPRKDRPYCKKHGVAECPLETPDIAQVEDPPKPTPADFARTARAIEGRPENDAKCKKHHRRLQFASREAVARAGIDAAPADMLWMAETVSANGEISYDQTRVARLSSRVPGTVARVFKQVGDPVQQGEVLALVDASEVGKAKTEYLQAFAQVDLRTRTLDNMRSAAGAIPARSIQEAETSLREARIRLLSAQQALVNLGLPVLPDDLKSLSDDKLSQRLQFLGLPDKLVTTLDPKTTSSNLLPIQAPITGVIVSREAVPGETADASKLLFIVADTSMMWLNLSLRAEDARLVKVGDPIHFRPDGTVAATIPWYNPRAAAMTWLQTIDGSVSWISTAVDEKTRTVRVRADLTNSDSKLRAGIFGTGRIVLRQEKTVVVPRDALQHEGCCNIVFVQDKNFAKPDAPKVYHVRKVVPGATNDQSVEIAAGLLPGESVVFKGASVLRGELLKNDLGAG